MSSGAFGSATSYMSSCCGTGRAGGTGGTEGADGCPLEGRGGGISGSLPSLGMGGMGSVLLGRGGGADASGSSYSSSCIGSTVLLSPEVK